MGASKRLPHALLDVVPPIALFALLILPVALAVTQLVRRQVRRLAEAVATGVLAGAAAEAANILLSRPAAARLYDAIIMSHPGVSHVDALDPYLAGLVAYATMIGLTGRPPGATRWGWRSACTRSCSWRPSHTTRAVDPDHPAGGPRDRPGRPVRGGLDVQRPSARDIAAALSAGRPGGDRDPAGRDRAQTAR